MEGGAFEFISLHVKMCVSPSDLLSQQHVLTSLRHGTIWRRHDKNGTVHAGGARNHILHVICMTRAVNMSIMPSSSLILHMCLSSGSGQRS
eukprot:scaffold18085_cov141-Isochrysis_galbana.AAC.2